MKIKRFVGGSLESNGYIISVKEKGNCYIIDPGYEADKFIKYIEKESLNLIWIESRKSRNTKIMINKR